MSSRRRFLNRTKIAQERQAREGRGFDPAGMVRLAGFGAALVVAAAVWVGFARESEAPLAGTWGVLHRLTQPLLFGVSAMEVLVILLAGLLALRYWRRMR